MTSLWRSLKLGNQASHFEDALMRRNRQFLRKHRRGTIAIMSAILAIVLIGMVAFSVDIGYVLSAKEELQRSADASALAACWEYGQKLADGYSSTSAASSARSTAVQYGLLNQVTNNGMTVDPNSGNSAEGDVVLGYIADFSNSSSPFQTDDPSKYNAVRVRMHKQESENGEVPYFFARIFGLSGQVLHSTATAGIVRNINGFQTPSDGSNVDILPFALDITTWNNLISGNSTDEWRWDENCEHSVPGTDGLVEVNLYPQGTGSPGNRGTVDIGGCNNSTSDIARQILEGVSPDDLSHHGGKLEFDESGKLYLNGDTGISAGVKDELTSIIGDPRTIPVFESVSGNGNNANYTIVKWQGIRIMDVKLTGPMSKKHVTIQVCPVLARGVIPSTSTTSSSYVFSPVVLVQ
jgi:Flp pilus assembly protein TadG